MIRAVAGNTYIIGLSARNLELLQQRKPIVFDASELDEIVKLDGNVLILWGETEADIMRDLETLTASLPSLPDELKKE